MGDRSWIHGSKSLVMVMVMVMVRQDVGMDSTVLALGEWSGVE